MKKKGGEKGKKKCLQELAAKGLAFHMIRLCQNCVCFLPGHSRDIYLKALYQMYGLISVLFCQNQSREEQDHSKGE